MITAVRIEIITVTRTKIVAIKNNDELQVMTGAIWVIFQSSRQLEVESKKWILQTISF